MLLSISQSYNISESEIAKKIGKSQQWVNQRVRMVTNLHQSVITAIDEGKVTFAVASRIIATLPITTQELFLIYLLENNIRSEVDALAAKKRFLNKTIYTIGYEGRELPDFIQVIKDNKIESVMDIRFSAESTYKPDFNKVILLRELEREGIHYEHHPELGVPYEWQNPYKDGAVPVECLEKYYKWHTSNEIDFPAFISQTKLGGKTVLLCMEKYAKPTRTQSIHCHRHILANLMLTTGEFEERVDL